MPIWETATEWDAGQSETGVHHEQPSATDWAVSDKVEKGYPTSWTTWGITAPTSYWPIDDDSGPLTDVVGSDNLSLTGTTKVSGILSTDAREGDGTDDDATVSYSTDFGSTDSLSVSCWIKISDRAGTNDYDNSFFDHNDGNDNFTISIQGGPSGDASLGSPFIWTSGSNTLNDGSIAVDDNTWHHIAVAWDQSNSNVKIWVDNSLSTDVTSYSDTSSVTNATLRLFRDNNTHVDADLDEVMYWVGYELTSTDVSELYNAAV